MRLPVRRLILLQTPASHQQSASLARLEGRHAPGQLELRWLQVQPHDVSYGATCIAISLPLNKERINRNDIDFFSNFDGRTSHASHLSKSPTLCRLGFL
jgi:hypothetical protein